MLIFDEKAYAENLLKSKEFNTYRQRDIERYILIRYLFNEGKSYDEIKEELKKFPLVGCEYLDRKEKELVYNKILEKALSYPLITNIKVDIYQEEMDIVSSLDNENAKRLLFVLLVYYKWAINQPYLYFFSRYNSAKMVITNDMDVWKYANLMKLRVADRYKLCNELINKKLYIEDNFKSHNYFYLPFVKKEGKIALSIVNYGNIIGELEYFYDKKSYKRCKKCGIVIKKTRSPKKYCSNCAKIVKNEQNKRYYQSNKNLGKTQESKPFEK